MSTKMKGLLKGLRYISQIFGGSFASLDQRDSGGLSPESYEEKEPEMKIGFPTDVKHVAHIGWDGPSVTSPSWMGNYKNQSEFSSGTMGEDNQADENSSVKSVSEDSSRRCREPNSPARSLPELPKSSRRQSDSSTREKSEKPRHSRRHHSGSGGCSTQSSSTATKDSIENDSPSLSILPGIPKKSRRKKSKESITGGSTRSSRSSKSNHNTNGTTNNNEDNVPYMAQFSDPGPETGSKFRSDDQLCQSSRQSFEEKEEKAIVGIS